MRRQIKDITRFGEILDEFKPDLVSWWNLEGVTKAILRMSPDRGIPSVHCIDDNWMIREFGAAGDVDLPFWFDFWRVKWGPCAAASARASVPGADRTATGTAGVPTRVFGVPPGHACFISGFWRFLHQQAGLDVRSSDVIYGGVSPEKFFVDRPPADYMDGPLRFSMPGISTSGEGCTRSWRPWPSSLRSSATEFHLSVAHAGPVVPDEYVNRITDRIVQLGLSKHVTFLGRVTHDEMPGVYAEHHVLVFASTRNEGMPMVMMEAMCAGCAVPNTGSGGAIELAEQARRPRCFRKTTRMRSAGCCVRSKRTGLELRTSRFAGSRRCCASLPSSR